MATKKQAPIKVSNSALKAMERLKGNGDRILIAQNDIGKGLVADGQKMNSVNQDINKLVSGVYNGFVGVGGNDYSAQELNQILSLSRKNVETGKANIKKQIIDFKKNISGNAEAMEIVKTRKEFKTSLYQSYDMIINIIPKMRMAIKTIANAIISPDDFSKKSLSVYFETSNISEEDTLRVQERMAKLVEEYKLDKHLTRDISEYLVRGELFWSVLSLNSEIKALLKEDVTLSKNEGYRTLSGTCNNLLSESTCSAEESYLVDEGLALFNEGLETSKKISRETLINDIDSFFSERVYIGSSRQFLSECLNEAEEINNAATFKNTIRDANLSPLENSTIDGLKLKTDSVIVRKLDSSNIVKLEYDEKVYGYLYVNTIAIEESKTSTTSPNTSGSTTPTQNNSISGAINAVVYSSNDIGKDFAGGNAGAGSFNNPKLKFISDMFANRLSKKENIKILKKNEQVKAAFYHSLIARRITKDERLQVIFFSPNEIVHIDRNESIFDNILFFAKMYIATLITILMQNIVRGADKRAYYVDVGLENDAANAINSVIRDIKSKDVAGVHNMDMQSMMNVLSDFSDFYIPTININLWSINFFNCWKPLKL